MNKNSINSYLTVSLFVSLLSVCMMPLVSAQRRARVYIGGSSGSFSYQEDANVFSTDVDFEETERSFKLFAGYRPSRSYSYELSYADFGGPEGQAAPNINAEGDVDALFQYGVRYIQLGNAELFGKAGTVYWQSETEYTDTTTGRTQTTDSSGFDLAAGLGVQYYLSKNIALRGEIEKILTESGKGSDVSDVDQTFWTLGLSIRF